MHSPVTALFITLFALTAACASTPAPEEPKATTTSHELGDDDDNGNGDDDDNGNGDDDDNSNGDDDDNSNGDDDDDDDGQNPTQTADAQTNCIEKAQSMGGTGARCGEIATASLKPTF